MRCFCDDQDDVIVELTGTNGSMIALISVQR